LTHKRKSDRNIQTRKQRNDPKFKTKQRLFEKEGDRETKGSQTKKLGNKSPHPPSFPTTSHPKPFSDKAKTTQRKDEKAKKLKIQTCLVALSPLSLHRRSQIQEFRNYKQSLSTTHKQSRQTAYL
jgi:hypothetical protein